MTSPQYSYAYSHWRHTSIQNSTDSIPQPLLRSLGKVYIFCK